MKRRDALKRTLLAAGTVSATPTLLAVLQSCQSQPRLEWKPLFFSNTEARFISKIVDLWLPKTDTPGALDVKVDIFIDTVFSKMLPKELQDATVEAIANMNNECQEKFGADFADIAEEEQVTIMKKAESESGTFNKGVWGTAVGEQKPVGFYRSLKSLAMWGYFSSEEIGKNVLNYDPVPGAYLGCIPLGDVGNAWSL